MAKNPRYYSPDYLISDEKLPSRMPGDLIKKDVAENYAIKTRLYERLKEQFGFDEPSNSKHGSEMYANGDYNHQYAMTVAGFLATAVLPLPAEAINYMIHNGQVELNGFGSPRMKYVKSIEPRITEENAQKIAGIAFCLMKVSVSLGFDNQAVNSIVREYVQSYVKSINDKQEDQLKRDAPKVEFDFLQYDYSTNDELNHSYTGLQLLTKAMKILAGQGKSAEIQPHIK